MTPAQLAAVIALRDLGVQLNAITPEGRNVVDDRILNDVDDLIAEERMRQRLVVGTTREDIRRDTFTPALHSVRADSDQYADLADRDRKVAKGE